MNKQVKIAFIVIAILSITIVSVDAAIPEDTYNVSKYLERIYSRIIYSILPKLDTLRADQMIRYEYTLDYTIQNPYSVDHVYSLESDKPFEIAAIYIHVADPVDIAPVSNDQFRLAHVNLAYMDKAPIEEGGYPRYYEMGSAELASVVGPDEPVVYIRQGIEVLNACGITVRPTSQGRDFLYSNFFRLSVALHHPPGDQIILEGNEVLHIEILYYAPPNTELVVQHTEVPPS